MSWSANEGGPPPDDVTGDGVVTPVNANEMQKLEMLIAKRKGKKTSADNMSTAVVNQKTDRVITDSENFITKTGEFRYTNNKPVKSKISYHIHYTTDLQEVYMTGHEHGKLSKIIYPNTTRTDFQYYNNLNQQVKMKISGDTVFPDDSTYLAKFFYRFFARQANDVNADIFEITGDKYNSSPLYIYVKVKWHLTGTERDVSLKNKASILVASKTIPNLYKAVNPLQYYRYDINLNVKDSILSRLGNPTSNTESTEAVGWSANDGGPPPGY